MKVTLRKQEVSLLAQTFLGVSRPVTRIFCGGGGGGGGWANKAKVDQTTEMYFLLSDSF